MTDSIETRIRVVSEIGEASAEEWNRCAAVEAAAAAPDNPFVSHAFLEALEDSGSVAAETGWLPQHLLLESGDGALLGCMPCYLKGHSQGEYVFDYAWAEAYARAGGQYYPKLQSAIPFTPVAGRRLLVPPGEDEAERRALLICGAAELTRRRHASSFNVTFPTKAEWEALGERGFLQRTDQQFHWNNNGYASFDDFLGTLASRKRKAVRKERRDALADGIAVEWVSGRDLTEAHWDAFFDFYTDTGSRKWGSPYLNRAFFSLVGAAMADCILLVLCKRAGRYIAGAMNFIGSNALYGRYWGCVEHHPSLHFEACYYQAIDFAIQRGLKRVEAGAQGEHKLARGYLPVPTYSAHYIADPGLRRAVADYLRRERAYVQATIEALSAEGPYRNLCS